MAIDSCPILVQAQNEEKDGYWDCDDNGEWDILLSYSGFCSNCKHFHYIPLSIVGKRKLTFNEAVSIIELELKTLDQTPESEKELNYKQICDEIYDTFYIPYDVNIKLSNFIANFKP